MTITARTIGTTEERLSTVQLERTALVIYNTHATAVVYFANSRGVSTSNGFPIPAGGSISLKIPEDDPTEEIWIISDTASTGIRVYEGYGKLIG